MEWKAQLVSSIEAAVERLMCATVEESTEDTARRRKRWLRIQLVEDRVKRDPVYAEKLSRRHAAFHDSISVAEKVAMVTSTSTESATILTACVVSDGNQATRTPTTCLTKCSSRVVASSVSALTATTSPTSSTSTGDNIPECCYYDLEPVAAASTPTCSRSDLNALAASCTSKRSMSIQTAAAADSIVGATSICNNYEVGLVESTTCSTQFPSRDFTESVSALAPAVTSDSFKVTIGVVPECCCSDPEPIDVTWTLISKLDVSGAQASALLGPDLSSTPPTTSSVVFLDPIHVAPAAVLTQATLDIMDSRGYATLVTMSVQLDTPEGVDTAVTDEDERLLAGYSIEQPLVLVAAMDVAGDHSFVTCASTMSLTLLALGVHDGSITNEHKVALTLKLMDMSQFKTKEMSMSVLLPQLALATFSWGTSLNRLHANYSGTSFDLSLASATTHLISFLPWDPGEKTSVSTYSIIGRDIVSVAGVKRLNADSSDNRNHHKSGYAKIQKYFHWPIQVFCSSQNVLGKCSCKGIYVELLRYQFDSTGYPQVPLEYFLVGSFCDVWINFHSQYPEASSYWSMTANSVPYHYAHITVGLGFPYRSVSLSCENSWSSLCDIWVANWRSNELIRPCILWSQSTTLLILACVNITLKEPMGQWDPCIARIIRRYTQYYHVSCLIIAGLRFLTNAYHILWGNSHCSELIEWSYLQSELEFCTSRNIIFCSCVLEQWKIPWTGSLVSVKSWFQYYGVGREYMYKCKNFQWTVAWTLSCQFSLSDFETRLCWLVLLVEQNCPAIYQEKWFQLLAMGSSGAGSPCLCNGIVAIMFQPHFQLGMPALLQCKDLSFWRYPCLGQMMLKTGHVIQLSMEFIQGKIAWSFNLKYSDVVNQFKEQIFAATRRYSVLYSPWDPGIWELLGFYGFSAQAKVQGDIMVEARTYYYYDQYFDAFLDTNPVSQVNCPRDFLEEVRATCYLNLVKVCFDYDTHRDLGDVMNHQVPWDPGGSTRHRLEVKPKLKEEGMLATLLSADGPPLLGQALLGSQARRRHIYE